MAGSWRELHYLQRPAKNIERRMIAELVLRLDRLRTLDQWRYVGFGSVYFGDFNVIHRTTGITSMVNIEVEDTVENRERFDFNKPFGCIELRWGPSSTVLPSLEWTQPTVLWLDYDGKLDESALSDIVSVVTRCATPTLLMVSVNVESSGPNDDVLREFSENVSPGRVPAGTVPGDVGGWGLAKLAYEVVVAEVKAAMADRNGASEPDDRIHWHQLLHFQYADGARMLTVGGLLFGVQDLEALTDARFDELFFARDSAEAYRIRVPNITTREILHLAGQMPADHQYVSHSGIPLRERRDFAEAYRYFPAYVAVDL